MKFFKIRFILIFIADFMRFCRFWRNSLMPISTTQSTHTHISLEANDWSHMQIMCFCGGEIKNKNFDGNFQCARERDEKISTSISFYSSFLSSPLTFLHIRWSKQKKNLDFSAFFFPSFTHSLPHIRSIFNNWSFSAIKWR